MTYSSTAIGAKNIAATDTRENRTTWQLFEGGWRAVSWIHFTGGTSVYTACHDGVVAEYEYSSVVNSRFETVGPESVRLVSAEAGMNGAHIQLLRLHGECPRKHGGQLGRKQRELLVRSGSGQVNSFSTPGQIKIGLAPKPTAWVYATQDPESCDEIAGRLGLACRKRKTVTYAELSRGIKFRLPDVKDGQPFVIDIEGGVNISSADKFILDDFLCFLSFQSLSSAGIVACANVVNPSELGRGAPTGFLEIAKTLGLRPAIELSQPGRKNNLVTQIQQINFWTTELKKVYTWFDAHPMVETD